MTVEFTGKVVNALPLQSGVGARGPWARATVVFEVQEGRYSQKIACENTNKAEEFSRLQPGQMVHVKADVSSREYNGKWFTSALCFEFEAQGAQPQQQQYAAPPASGSGPAGQPF